MFNTIIKFLKRIFSYIYNKIKFLFYNNEEKIIIIDYTKKKPLTNTEIDFYNKLLKFEELNPNYKIVFQIPLSAIINKNSNYKGWQNELYRVIDFAIFNKNTYDIELLIELNDNNHLNNPKTIERDKKVLEICNLANIKLIKFWLQDKNGNKYENTEEYIIKRINKLLIK